MRAVDSRETGGSLESGGGRGGRSAPPRAARERDPLRGHQDRLLLARPRSRPARDRRHRDRRDRMSRLLHLLPRGRSPGAARRSRRVLGVRRQARLGRRRGPRRLGRTDEDARVHPRERDGGSADEVRSRARGGELPVDGRGADPGQGRRRDRGRRPAHRGAAGVRRRRAQLPRPHRLAGRRRDRERPALRGDAPARAGADDADPAEPGARRGHPARGPLRRGRPRGARAAARRRLPDLPPRRRGRRARPRRARTPLGGRRRARAPAAPAWCST